MREIFKNSVVQTSDWTYVPARELPEIAGLLTSAGNALLVEGPSRIGKSTAVRAALGEAKATWLAMPGDLGHLNAIIEAKAFEGHLVIDNAHRLDDRNLPRDTMDRLVDFIRTRANTTRPGGMVTLLARDRAGRNLARSWRDLETYVDKVPMKAQPRRTIEEIIRNGESAANVRFKFASLLAAESRGSPRLAQQLCYRAAVQAGVYEVAATRRHVNTKPADIQGRLCDELDLQFGGPIGRFLRADRDAETRGGCLALLWLRSILGEDEPARIDDARTMFPSLRGAFDWLASGALAHAIEADTEVAELFSCDGSALFMEDPQLGYYLRKQDWRALGALSGVEVSVEADGTLSRWEQRPTQHRMTHFLDARPYPYDDGSARKFRDILIKAYPTIEAAAALADDAGVPKEDSNRQGGVRGAWHHLLQAAALKGCTRELVFKVLGDERAESYYAEIRELTGLQ